MNTCFQKRKIWLITFRLGETETMINYILVDGHSVQKEGQEESKIKKEIETVEVERVRGEKKSLLKGLTTNLMVVKISVA